MCEETPYRRERLYSDVGVSETKLFTQLETGNRRLTQLVMELTLDSQTLQDPQQKEL